MDAGSICELGIFWQIQLLGAWLYSSSVSHYEDQEDGIPIYLRWQKVCLFELNGSPKGYQEVSDFITFASSVSEKRAARLWSNEKSLLTDWIRGRKIKGHELEDCHLS